MSSIPRVTGLVCHSVCDSNCQTSWRTRKLQATTGL